MYTLKLSTSLLLVSLMALPQFALAQDAVDALPAPQPVSSESVADERPATAEEDDGPELDLPPEDEPATDADASPDDALPKKDYRPISRVLQSPNNGVNIAGYGEMHYTRIDPEEGQVTNEVDMHRMVLYVGKQFNERISFGAEIEVEHAIVGDGKVGEVSVEQAIVDYGFTATKNDVGSMGLRAGIMLVPMGIVNQWHEPPLFHGVERPAVDKVIIPSTWREGGIGFYHKPTEELSYELYVMGGLDPLKFSAKNGIRGGRQKVGEARADALAFTGRGEYKPNAQTVIGLGGYYSQAGKNADEVDADVSVLGVAADARTKHKGFEARAEFAMFKIGDSDALNAVTDADGAPITDVADTIMGTFAELAYDVFYTMDMDEQLLPFARVEYYNTDPDDDTRAVIDIVTGLTFRPIPQVVFKGDVIFRRKGGDVVGDNSTLLNLGVGFLY